MHNKNIISVKTIALGSLLACGVFAQSANAAVHVTTIDAATHAGATGTITFDDWGFNGPNGRGYADFDPINGFGNNPLDTSGGIGQIQHVVTQEHDWVTPDAPQTVLGDLGVGGPYTNANMDTGVNFYQWGYTSPGGSTFNNMLIDYDGDYFVAQNDMTFNFYNYFDYKQEGTTGGLADGRYPTKLAFQPYTLSDAKGWCGSVLASHPNALEPMAGQLTFDFAFDVYFQIDLGGGNFYYSYSNTEIVSGFKMGSYGDITVDVNTSGGDAQQFSARAVVNNTDPGSGNAQVEGAPVDPDYKNLVSFMGADVLSSTGMCGELSAEWAGGARGPGVKKFSGLINEATDATACTAAGGTWQLHAYSGYAFILRADGMRILDYFDESVYGPDPVPIPAAVWLFGSGLIGMVGAAYRRRRSYA